MLSRDVQRLNAPCSYFQLVTFHTSGLHNYWKPTSNCEQYWYCFTDRKPISSCKEVQ